MLKLMIEKLSKFVCVAHPKKKNQKQEIMREWEHLLYQIPKNNTKLPLSLEY